MAICPNCKQEVECTIGHMYIGGRGYSCKFSSILPPKQKELTLEEQNEKMKQFIAAIYQDIGSENVDDIGKIKEWKEKAEKLDMLEPLMSENGLKLDYSKIRLLRDNLNIIMEGLEVVDSCSHTKEGDGNPDWQSLPRCCTYCHGTGQITRPATVEEVREMIEFWMERWFKLKSGAIMRMKEGK